MFFDKSKKTISYQNETHVVNNISSSVVCKKNIIECLDFTLCEVFSASFNYDSTKIPNFRFLNERSFVIP